MEGVAYADLFPRICVAALLGQSGAAGNWRGGDAALWGASGSLLAPLFDGGAGRARVNAASAEVKVATAVLQKSVLGALEETDTAIAAWTQLRRQNEELATGLGLARESSRLARLRFEHGAESLSGVLESERIALEAAEQMARAEHDLLLATARSYVAMAGGFDLDNRGAVLAQ
jgi:multidrug efflux system outer membrane protein